MEIKSFPYLNDAGTDWEAQEEMSVIVIPRNYSPGYYFLVNAHHGDHMRFEVDGIEEVDPYIEMFQWMKDYITTHPVGQPESDEQENADDPHPVEEDG